MFALLKRAAWNHKYATYFANRSIYLYRDNWNSFMQRIFALNNYEKRHTFSASYFSQHFLTDFSLGCEILCKIANFPTNQAGLYGHFGKSPSLSIAINCSFKFQSPQIVCHINIIFLPIFLRDCVFCVYSSSRLNLCWVDKPLSKSIHLVWILRLIFSVLLKMKNWCRNCNNDEYKKKRTKSLYLLICNEI